ncbi:hypothetical protein H6P81_004151 [Aristolochia fimbriata]|uniref:Protein SirB1 N-terminal domain-containing protein n=1 Tax=Aristolochia fimbriata TaxID=158543 RepID=A0AAV7FFE1_ARIFI|nr:hypothetical protein H6P81_004151 [Aristolochia fimbriata]
MMTSSYFVPPSGLAFSAPSSFSVKHPSRCLFNSSPIICHCVRVENDLGFVLHDALDASGGDTRHARAAREAFCSQIERLSSIERETSIVINRGVDLGKAALHIAAEDDALVSHSSVPLPVDAFLERLDDLSMGFCPLYFPPAGSSPEVFLSNLERYFYVHHRFRRADPIQSDTRPLYLHSVLTRRSGSAAMLSLIYSEMLKLLRLWGFMDFDAEIYYPLDAVNLPRGYHKQKSKVSDDIHILTSESLLVEILKNLKHAFWPFPNDNAKSLFLRAAQAANCIKGPTMGKGSLDSYNNMSGLEVASAKAAQHRLGRGVWTSVRFGDMRCALAACERLILLGFDSHELRDYGVLLYHCGFYKESLQYLKLYLAGKDCAEQMLPASTAVIETDALEKLMVRLELILIGEGWGHPPAASRNFLGKYSEPW